MKSLSKIAVLITILAALAIGCKTSRKSIFNTGQNEKGGNAVSGILLKAPVNSADENELRKKIYYDDTYSLLQNQNDKFKDNAPFVQYLDSGKRERLWFSSSRADVIYYRFKKTNTYQQIYYCDREVGEGKAPNEGWGEVHMFQIKTDNPYLENFCNLFNQSTKGAVSIAGNRLVFSSDLIKETGNSEFKDLWEVEIRDGKFDIPKPITALSNLDTWESQPSLSVNGKHLFFVSDRKIEKDGKTIVNNLTSNNLNIFYSFYDGSKWSAPVAVIELNSDSSDITPQIRFDQSVLYFSSNREGNFQIYEVPLKLDNLKGGYAIRKNEIKLFSDRLFATSGKEDTEVKLNDGYNQQYPFVYYNPLNRKSPRSLFWAADNPGGFGGYDLYGCDLPFEVELNAVLVDRYVTIGRSIDRPVIELKGFNGRSADSCSSKFTLYSGLSYQLFGGSTASPENGTYSCDIDPSFIHVGYSKPDRNHPIDKNLHSEIISGPVVESELTWRKGKILVSGILNDTVIYDTVFITKAWMKKPPCPRKLNIDPTYRSIAYFQTGYWEVNTSENLKRDLIKLHDGFEVEPNDDLYRPSKITRNRSDYNVVGYDSPIFPVKTTDRHSYSIANAPWIELHPNNQYWGDRPGFESKLQLRMLGRKERINQYVDYAKKVDENLNNLTDTIKYKYIQLLDKHQGIKPKLLIEIFAVSDKREVTRSWYIGDTVQYRGSEYLEWSKSFNTEMVKIIPPDVDERTKTITRIKPCSIDLNSEGDNGSILGIAGDLTDLNTNLSRLRAWYGYREVLKRLTDSEIFNRYNSAGRVALPDNKVSYDDADIIIITRGKREDGDVDNPRYPYPSANNPTGNGFFDYDQIRRIEIQTRLLYGNEKSVVENYCCDPVETGK
jgi:hypothetical protein